MDSRIPSTFGWHQNGIGERLVRDITSKKDYNRTAESEAIVYQLPSILKPDVSRSADYMCEE